MLCCCAGCRRRSFGGGCRAERDCDRLADVPLRCDAFRRQPGDCDRRLERLRRWVWRGSRTWAGRYSRRRRSSSTRRLASGSSTSGTSAESPRSTRPPVAVIWQRATGNVLSSPAVANGVVYVGSVNHYLYALDAANGKLDCRFQTAGDDLVIAGRRGPGRQGPGGVLRRQRAIRRLGRRRPLWAINAVDPNSAANCSLKWQFNWFSDAGSGVWSSPAYAVDRFGDAAGGVRHVGSRRLDRRPERAHRPPEVGVLRQGGQGLGRRARAPSSPRRA